MARETESMNANGETDPRSEVLWSAFAAIEWADSSGAESADEVYFCAVRQDGGLVGLVPVWTQDGVEKRGEFVIPRLGERTLIGKAFGSIVERPCIPRKDWNSPVRYRLRNAMNPSIVQTVDLVPGQFAVRQKSGGWRVCEGQPRPNRLNEVPALEGAL